MSKSYDVIVIGAGLGGLSAATFLARNGLRVCLLERHNLPGGYATSFVRGRYEFEVALHELSGIGREDRRGGLYRYLEYLGVAERVQFIHLPNLYRAIFPDLDITLPAGRQEFEETLIAHFPHEARGIKRFLKRVFDFGHDFAQVTRRQGKVNPLLLPFQYPHLFRYLPVTWGQVLYREVHDAAARAVLSQYWGYVGLPPAQISFVYMATTLAAYVTRGAAFPVGRSQALSNAFLDVFLAHGGEVRFNCGAKRIIVEHGHTAGVITDTEEALRAPWVISNADPLTTCKELIGAEHIPPSFFQNLQSSEIAPSTVNVYLGVARAASELGLNEHEIFINADYEFERHFESTKRIQPPQAIALTCYNAAYADISPPGTCIVVLTALSFGKPWLALSPREYLPIKRQLGEAMIAMAERVAPGLSHVIEEMEISTPLTNMRYAGTLGGSIYGFSQPPRDHMIWRMRPRGPIDGLYFVGAWTQPGGGFEPTIMSGQIAAGTILRKMRAQPKGG